MSHHPGVVQERVEPLAVDRHHRRDPERVPRQHQEQQERLHQAHDRQRRPGEQPGLAQEGGPDERAEQRPQQDAALLAGPRRGDRHRGLERARAVLRDVHVLEAVGDEVLDQEPHRGHEQEGVGDEQRGARAVWLLPAERGKQRKAG